VNIHSIPLLLLVATLISLNLYDFFLTDVVSPCGCVVDSVYGGGVVVGFCLKTNMQKQFNDYRKMLDENFE
jgi:hypothetical protein